MINIIPNGFVVVEHIAGVTVGSPRQTDLGVPAHDPSSLGLAAVVVLGVVTEFEAGLVTSACHVVHDEVVAEAAEVRPEDGHGAVRVETEHATHNSSVSSVPLIITSIMSSSFISIISIIMSSNYHNYQSIYIYVYPNSLY